MSKPISYKDAGVDIDAGNESVNRIKSLVQDTYNDSVLAGIGSFGGMVDLGLILKDYKHPVLVQSIDSVGTKLIVANMVGRHDTIGIDMVAHSCNDILCQGAKPISFLDYIAVNKVRPEHIEAILKGISIGCREAGFPVIGGEIAELPGVYMGEEYELVGAVTGVVEKEKIVDGGKIQPGDKLIGLKSSGLHTNGYSLARKVLFGHAGHSVHDYMEELGATLGEELLRPHKNYSVSVLRLMEVVEVRGICHITGGGLVGNIPRILPKGVDVSIRRKAWEVPPIFQLIQRTGRVPEEDMLRTFNMGIGLVLLIRNEDTEKAMDALKNYGEEAIVIGEAVGSGTGKVLFK